MRLLLLVFCLFSVGCTTAVHVNETAYFDKVEVIEPLEVQVEVYPQPQVIRTTSVDGNDYAALTKEELDKYREYKSKAVANAERLQAVVDASNALIVERNLLLDAAKSQERRANMLERDYARTEEKLRKEEQMRIIEGAIYKVIILGLAIGL